jgi:hypothetical protein
MYSYRRPLLERLGKHRLRLTDGERRRLAKLGKALGGKALQQVATIATPDTILRSSCAETGSTKSGEESRSTRWPPSR